VVNVTNLSNKVDHPFQKPSQNGLNGKFMSVDKVFQSAQRQKLIGQYIPPETKNPQPVRSHWQSLPHNVVSSTPHHEQELNSQL
jgi:hypothetical protein